MVSHVSSKNSIIIDNFTFIIISKLVDNFQRFYIRYISINNYTQKKVKLYASTSISEIGCWRLCIFKEDGLTEKYDNYIQSTILDFRLQNFIWSVFEKLPETKLSESDKKITTNLCPKIKILYLTDIINSRKLTLNKFPYYKYDKIHGNKMINNNYYDIVDDDNKPITNSRDILRTKIHFTNYEINMGSFRIKNEIFGIRIRNKIDGLVIIVQIGKFNLIKEIDDEIIEKHGYFPINLIPLDFTINILGLYSIFYEEFEDKYTIYKRPDEHYITKVLDYKLIIDKYYLNSSEKSELEIGDPDYGYIAFLNKDKFIIKELEEGQFDELEDFSSLIGKSIHDDYDESRDSFHDELGDIFHIVPDKTLQKDIKKQHEELGDESLFQMHKDLRKSVNTESKKSNSYFNKYLKYKNKYLQLKIINK
jgi:hypothetical protein